MTDPTSAGGAAPRAGTSIPGHLEIVTKRPSLGPMVLLVTAVATTALFVWATPKADAARRAWSAASPVLVVVGGGRGDGTAEVTEYGTDRSWTVAQQQLERIGAAEVGARIQARVAGDCRCELLLQEPSTIPAYVMLAPLALGAVSVPGILARRRWRHLRRVLEGPSRPVRLEPVWLRRSFAPSMFGARVVAVGPKDVDGRGPGSDPVVELAGTPASWFPVGTSIDMFGPDPENGLTVFRIAETGAVASTAPRSGPSVEKRVLGWSSALARATGLIPPVEPGAIGVGGAPHQRISVGSAGEAHGTLTLRPARTERSKFFLLAGLNVAWIVVFLVLEPTGPWLVLWLLAVAPAFLLLRRRVAARLAAREPFASWADRTAAGEAALAAAFLGYIERGEPET